MNPKNGEQGAGMRERMSSAITNPSGVQKIWKALVRKREMITSYLRNVSRGGGGCRNGSGHHCWQWGEGTPSRPPAL